MSKSQQYNEEEISLFDLVSIILSQKLILIIPLTISIVLAISYLQIAEQKYTITQKVTPVSTVSDPMKGSLGQLASLTGANFGKKSGTVFELYFEGIHSLETAKVLAKNVDILAKAFPKYWDANNNEWVKPTGIIQFLKNFFNVLVGRPQLSSEKPSDTLLQDFLQREVKIIESLDSSIVSVSIKTADINFGKKVLLNLHQISDEELRKRALERSSRQINYLTLKLGEIKNIEHRQVLATALLEQEDISMMASSNLPFASEPFGAPYPSLKPTNPNPIIIIPMAIILSLFLSSLWIIRIHYIASTKILENEE
ncbi:Wzz/FepE/Etk N-terminal domain-containing protein [Emcibacteraceae bacterium]|nr:Wzz/FepE/Etk N-terminal domain-containing protein [Emcibacteraceae bacterium]